MTSFYFDIGLCRDQSIYMSFPYFFEAASIPAIEVESIR